MTSPDTVGLLASILSVALPGATVFAVSRFKPESRAGYSIKAALWPAALFTLGLGGPLARAVLGVRTGQGLTLTSAIQGYVVLALAFGAVCFAARYIVRRSAPVADRSPLATVGGAELCGHCHTGSPTKTLTTGEVRCSACGFLVSD